MEKCRTSARDLPHRVNHSEFPPCIDQTHANMEIFVALGDMHREMRDTRTLCCVRGFDEQNLATCRNELLSVVISHLVSVTAEV
jgi:hypothetical protein